MGTASSIDCMPCMAGVLGADAAIRAETPPPRKIASWSDKGAARWNDCHAGWLERVEEHRVAGEFGLLGSKKSWVRPSNRVMYPNPKLSTKLGKGEGTVAIGHASFAPGRTGGFNGELGP